MNANDLRFDFDSLRGDWGLYCPNVVDKRSDNGALFTTEYYLCLKRLGKLTQEDITRYRILMNQIMLPCGMTTRQPGSKALDSPDNLIAFAVGSKAFGCDFATRILEYGKTTFPNYIFNPQVPGKFTFASWMGRQIGLIGFIKHCAGKKMSLLEQIFLWIGVRLTMRKSFWDSSDKLLTQIMMEQMPGSRTAKMWDKYVIDTYGSVERLVSIYFGPDNPFRKWWK